MAIQHIVLSHAHTLTLALKHVQRYVRTCATIDRTSATKDGVTIDRTSASVTGRRPHFMRRRRHTICGCQSNNMLINKKEEDYYGAIYSILLVMERGTQKAWLARNTAVSPQHRAV